MKRSPARFTEEKSNLPIVRPMKQPYSYRCGMSDAYLHELARRLECLNPTQDVAVLVAYVAYRSESTSHFVNSFFPFALAAPLRPFFRDQALRHERRKALLSYCDDIEIAVGRLRDKARVVRDVFSGQNFTPLLLPLRNFRSDILLPRVEELYGNLGTVDDPRATLLEAKNSLLRRHPIQHLVEEPDQPAYFQDGRRLRFRAWQQSARHGAPSRRESSPDLPHRCARALGRPL